MLFHVGAKEMSGSAKHGYDGRSFGIPGRHGCDCLASVGEGLNAANRCLHPRHGQHVVVPCKPSSRIHQNRRESGIGGKDCFRLFETENGLFSQGLDSYSAAVGMGITLHTVGCIHRCHEPRKLLLHGSLQACELTVCKEVLDQWDVHVGELQGLPLLMCREPIPFLQNHLRVVGGCVHNRLDMFCFDLPHQFPVLLTIVWVLGPVAKDVQEENNHLPFEGIPKKQAVFVVSIGGILGNIDCDVVELADHAHQAGSIVEQVDNGFLHPLQASVPAPGRPCKATGGAFLLSTAFQNMYHGSSAKCKLAVVQARQGPFPARHRGHLGSRVCKGLAMPRLVDATRTEPRQEAPETRVV
mmetsp:Transcript_15497/g.36549  ORF Transcript_15497/g.36549 Transcript_15497/m.36549 type:complete len:355 (+) Transcript_15497:327-1391(+)